MLRAFERTFQNQPEDPYFGVVLNLMHHVLPQLALSLMSTPAQEGGDADVGPNAAPTWTYLPDARLHDLRTQLRHLHAKAGKGRISVATAQAVEQALEGLQRMPAAASAQNLL
jgi:hypothetical protein